MHASELSLPVESNDLRRVGVPAAKLDNRTMETADSCQELVNVLIGLMIMAASVTQGAPVLAPDIAICHLQNDTGRGYRFDCCAPPSASPPRAFQLPAAPPSNLKVRRPAHMLTTEESEKLAKAYELMRALPDTDPRSFGQQANIHCAYCSEFYTQPNSTVPLQIHASWLFFSFHRWYIYFHERILSSLLNDSSLALPFWNYDHPDGSSIPSAFLDYDQLQDRNRQPSHMPPAVVAIDTISLGMADRNRDDQLAVNREAFYWVMVAGALTPIHFFGQPYRAGDFQMPGYGTVETMPHTGVHAWVGDLSNAFLDMGDFDTAARDPLFYAHHAAIDRLWDVWKTLSLANIDIDDSDYLDSEFVFYDENAELVKVSVRDSLNSTLLGYTYEDVVNLWLNSTRLSLSSGPASIKQAISICKLGFEDLGDEPCSVEISTSLLLDGDAREDNAAQKSLMLVIEGIDVPLNCSPAALHFFVNLPSANASTPINCVEFAGSFPTLPSSSRSTSAPTSLHLSIGSIVRDLNLADQPSLVVTVVVSSAPISPSDCRGISISQIKIRSYEKSMDI